MAHAWKACWCNSLASSNLASSARKQGGNLITGSRLRRCRAPEYSHSGPEARFQTHFLAYNPFDLYCPILPPHCGMNRTPHRTGVHKIPQCGTPFCLPAPPHAARAHPFRAAVRYGAPHRTGVREIPHSGTVRGSVAYRSAKGPEPDGELSTHGSALRSRVQGFRRQMWSSSCERCAPETQSICR